MSVADEVISNQRAPNLTAARAPLRLGGVGWWLSLLCMLMRHPAEGVGTAVNGQLEPPDIDAGLLQVRFKNWS